MADDTAELRSRLERALAEAATSGASIGDAFLQLNRLLAPEPDRMQIWRLIRALAEPYPNLAEAHFAVALAAYNTGLTDIGTAASAAAAVDRALELKPGWERAVLLKAEILNKRSPAEAIAFLDRFPEGQPRLAARDRRAGAAVRRAEALHRGARPVRPAGCRRADQRAISASGRRCSPCR